MATRKKNSFDRLKKRQIPCYLESEQLDDLRRLSKTTRVPLQVFLREGVDLVLKNYKKELRA